MGAWAGGYGVAIIPDEGTGRTDEADWQAEGSSGRASERIARTSKQTRRADIAQLDPTHIEFSI